ncbi:uncharacterized protein LAESUDRAFT_577469 [Laetiporus sulphureus 93-53]|uniref:Uncharacterized protein n=1 Tax=Laetiporus sulphureus 93-53 TaxID=1314785 RepID=A0A165B0X2_9APHY|nr:uncharacterized protein LAESUDRAFT_577469 [Laetiporus sulphureus 93-53]KZT00019.1 hypothetical protein LAESUDRAFT_577469 [Laetiporus sulphureus 93-53]
MLTPARIHVWPPIAHPYLEIRIRCVTYNARRAPSRSHRHTCPGLPSMAKTVLHLLSGVSEAIQAVLTLGSFASSVIVRVPATLVCYCSNS